LILVLSVSVAYTVNIGHQLFPRDATEDLPSCPTRFPFPPDAPHRPGVDRRACFPSRV